MNLFHKIIHIGIVLVIGTSLASKFSYNLSIENKDKKWFTFIQHPIKFIINKGKKEQ